jgi:5-methylthioadenosine/S-adenosylhomocysteine deaminase
MWAIRGRIVPLSADPAVAPSDAAVFTGRVWMADDGTVAAVTKGSKAGPAGSGGAQVVDVGSSLVMPGLIDLHNHLAYNTLPLWIEPGQQSPFAHHNSWTRAETYAASTTWPAYALTTACPHELLAYVEAKAIVGGTTSIQGSPPKNRPRDGWLVRNIEDETFGSGNANLIYASVLTAKPAALAERANKMRSGSAFIYPEVIDRMEEVRAHPKREVEAANAMYARWAGRLDDRDAPLRLALDMPTGLAPVGVLPKDLNELVIPPLQSLTHDKEWLDSVAGRGFHSGVLDGLRDYYLR